MSPSNKMSGKLLLLLLFRGASGADGSFECVCAVPVGAILGRRPDRGGVHFK